MIDHLSLMNHRNRFPFILLQFPDENIEKDKSKAFLSYVCKYETAIAKSHWATIFVGIYFLAFIIPISSES